ncbi:hypothetical protein CDAR_196451 [Caerostris darwini]|uniref:Uncharacterized protein n=1 Tax=Caerostris darwini TaxID=1538125 RepID=A0AAV4Q091_9ARAC|nr:hypothetical protein CDAR_196451 [Caerostris darwini]
MSFVGRCYSLEEAASRNGDDERRNVHRIILMLQSGTARRRCHLLGDFIPLKKQRAGMETTKKKCSSYHFDVTIRNSKAKISFIGRCYSLEEAASRNGDDDRRNVNHIIWMLQLGTARRRCYSLEEAASRNGDDDRRNVQKISDLYIR